MNPHLLTPPRLLGVLVLGGLLLAVWWTPLVEKLGVDLPDRWFLDSYAILAANDAAQAGRDPTLPNKLDPLGRPHSYSDWWLGLRWLGLTRTDNFFFGGASVAGFLLVAFASVRPVTYREAVLVAAVMLAPPYLLAVQRANNDLVIFAVVGVGLLLAQNRADGARLAVFGFTAAIATGLKFYPLVVVVAPLLALPWRPTVLRLTVASALGSAVILATEARSLQRGIFDLQATVYLFGAPVLLRDFMPGRWVAVVAAAVIVAAGAWFAQRRGWTTGLADPARGTLSERLMFATGALLLVGCFLAGTSYAYRWIFGLWLWPWLHRQAASIPIARVALGLWLVSLWADGALCLVVNSFGLAYRPGTGWRYLTQPLNWAFIILLAAWLFDAARVRFAIWRYGERGIQRAEPDSCD